MGDRLLESVHPPGAAPWNQQERLRVRLMLVLSALALVVVPLFGTIYLFESLWLSAASLAGLGGVVMLAPVALRFGLSFEAAAHAIAAAFVTGLCVMSWAHGGFDPSTIAWIASTLLATALIGGSRVGLIWLIVATAATALLLVTDHDGVYPSAGRGSSRPPWLSFLGLTVLNVSVLSFAWLYTLFARRASSSLLRANAELRDAKDRAEAAHVAAEDARRAAEAANRSKTAFLANMSHEIRTPLNGVIGMAQLLNESDLGDEERDLARIVQESGTSLLTIINDILDLSKVEAGQLDLERIPFDLRSMLARVRGLFLHQAESKGLRFEVTEAPGLASTWMGDPTRIQQILVNLAANAIKFTDAGTVRVRALPRGDGAGVRFEVRDTGIGIDPSKLETIMEPFGQEDASTTREYGGTGLGLAITQRLVEAMRGTLEVTSRKGEGATFIADLPLCPASSRRAPSPAPRVRDDASAHRMRVLVVEDNAVNQKVAARMLERLDCDCVVVEDGQQAVDAVAREHFDLVFMDCQMPVLDGFEATRAIRAGGHDVPIVALTASALVEERARCAEAGMDDFLSKPVRFEDFRRVLDGVGSDEADVQPPRAARPASRPPARAAARGVGSEAQSAEGPTAATPSMTAASALGATSDA